MDPLPAANLRSNLGTWAVPACRGPAVANVMLHALPTEEFDPNFCGQALRTVYFDTSGFALRKARRQGDRYLTLRLRCYGDAQGGAASYALSAKTESDKWRREIDPGLADALLRDVADVRALLPPNLLARADELASEDDLDPVVTVVCTRYAVEDARDRLTLDLDVRTDTGKCLPAGVLEFKSSNRGSPPPGGLAVLDLRPLKLSKFLWATEWRG
jgi:hypothetical protein